MVTPENFRRRQRREGIALVCLGIFTVLITFYFGAQDRATDACIDQRLGEIADSQAKRSAIVVAESQATRDVISAALTSETEEDFMEARADYFAALEEIDADRKNNPPPNFPAGGCD